MNAAEGFAALLAALALTAAPIAAFAQEGQTLAQGLFSEGRRLMKEGKYAEACPKIAESYRLDPAGGAALNLALCYEADGKIASAWTSFNEALAFSRKDNNADREQLCREKIAALEPRLAKLTVKVSAGAKVAGLAVARDATKLGEAAWGVPLAVDPGDHTLTAEAPGYRPWRRKVTIAGDASIAEVDVPPLARLPEAQADDRGASARRIAGFAIGGVGVASAIVGAAFGGLALKNKSASDAQCGGDSSAEQCSGPAAQDAVSLNDGARTDAKVANGLVFGGLGLAVVGVVLVATAPRAARTEAPPSAFVLPVFGNRAGGVAFGARF